MNRLLEGLWGELRGASEVLGAVSFSGPREVLPSVYPVTDFAAGTIGLASLAVAELGALRRGVAIPEVAIDREHAAISFRSERYLDRPREAWPSLWDPIAGDYATKDGFIRLHTNYPHHRAAAMRALGGAEERDAVTKRVAALEGEALESAIVGEGGCAAAMRAGEAWRGHPQGAAVLAEPTVRMRETSLSGRSPERGRPVVTSDAKPLEGLRVLDLTRVIAGPICTRFLAAWGADVLRVDPPGFEEPDALVADTTVGKRCAALDLRSAEGRAAFDTLLAETDVLVHGYRSDALAALGYDDAGLRARNAGLVHVALDAYGFAGPWQARRGFDSLVQMSCGIAARGQQVFGTEFPKPLPAQALDHGTGYLLAAAVCRSLCEAASSDRGHWAQLSLAGTAKALMEMGEEGDPEIPEPTSGSVEPHWVEEEGVFGRIRRVACPGRIGGVAPDWRRNAGRLGGDRAEWC